MKLYECVFSVINKSKKNPKLYFTQKYFKSTPFNEKKLNEILLKKYNIYIIKNNYIKLYNKSKIPKAKNIKLKKNKNEWFIDKKIQGGSRLDIAFRNGKYYMVNNFSTEENFTTEEECMVSLIEFYNKDYNTLREITIQRLSSSPKSSSPKSPKSSSSSSRGPRSQPYGLFDIRLEDYNHDYKLLKFNYKNIVAVLKKYNLLFNPNDILSEKHVSIKAKNQKIFLNFYLEIIRKRSANIFTQYPTNFNANFRTTYDTLAYHYDISSLLKKNSSMEKSLFKILLLNGFDTEEGNPFYHKVIFIYLLNNGTLVYVYHHIDDWYDLYNMIIDFYIVLNSLTGTTYDVISLIAHQWREDQHSDIDRYMDKINSKKLLAFVMSHQEFSKDLPKNSMLSDDLLKEISSFIKL